MLVLSKNQAKAKADTLHKFLVEKGIELPKSEMLNAVARMAGFADWNAMAAQYKESAVDALLMDAEKPHVYDALDGALRDEETGGGGFGKELTLQTASGFWMVIPAEGELDYVRVCDPLGRETVYWSVDEFTAEASEVLPALFGALHRGRMDKMPNPLRPSADKIVVSDRNGPQPRTGLSAIAWSEDIHIRVIDPEVQQQSVHKYNSVIRHILESLDAERSGTATAEQLEDLDDYADDFAIDWSDAFEAGGLTTEELRGMVPREGGQWELEDGRLIAFMDLQPIL